MSNTTNEANTNQDQRTDDRNNPTENTDYTERQLRSSFEHSLQISQAPIPSSSESSQPVQNETSAAPASAENSNLRSDAPEFKPTFNMGSQSNAASAVDQTTASLAQSTEASSSDNQGSENQFDMNRSSIYDLKKYKHEYLISQLYCPTDTSINRFSSPTGITAIDDNQLLVADFNRDSVFLLGFNGVVSSIYPALISPKDIVFHSSRPSEFVVATKKELIAVDLSKGKPIRRSKLKGFYPWNVQYLHSSGIFAACDPSGERIVYMDKDFNEIGTAVLGNSTQPQQGQSGAGPAQKIYPYAVSFTPDYSFFALTHTNTCQLREYDMRTQSIKRLFSLPPTVRSYSIYADVTRKCLIVDEQNHRLMSVNPDDTIEEHRLTKAQNPYSLTFLSDATLCLTCRDQNMGTNSAVCILSENPRH